MGFFCVLVFILGLILPVIYLDDINYALDKYNGSIFSQQYNEYLTNHGRFFTHIWARIILQNRFIADLLMSLFVGLFFYSSWQAINPQFSLETKQRQIPLLWVLCLSLILFFTRGLWIALLMAAHFMSYRLTFLMLLFFLIPYLRFFADNNKSPQMILFSVVSLIAGSAHEQSVVLIPILILMGIIYSCFLKKKLPLWYYLGMLFFFIGILTILLSPYTFSEDRLVGYGKATNWEFFGQKINWLELGWKRYFYSLAKILYKWIPVSIAFIVFFVVMLIKSIKKLKAFSFDFVPSVVLFVISQAIIVVMMFSPRFTSGPMSLGMDFLVVSCISILSVYLNIINYDFKKHEKKIITTVIVITLITWGMQIPSAVQYRIDHNQKVDIVKEAIKNNQSEVYIKKLPRYSIGKITLIGPGSITKKLLMYQGLTNINIIIED